MDVVDELSHGGQLRHGGALLLLPPATRAGAREDVVTGQESPATGLLEDVPELEPAAPEVGRVVLLQVAVDPRLPDLNEPFAKNRLVGDDLGLGGTTVRHEVWPKLPVEPEEAVQLVRGPALGLDRQHLLHPPGGHLGPGGGHQLQQLRHGAGQLVPTEAGEEHLVDDGNLLLVLDTVVLQAEGDDPDDGEHNVVLAMLGVAEGPESQVHEGGGEDGGVGDEEVDEPPGEDGGAGEGGELLHHQSELSNTETAIVRHHLYVGQVTERLLILH